jgi:hypothetical protein
VVFGSPTRPAGRVFPTHFLTMWMTGLPLHHAGRVGDLGWALAWMIGAAVLAWAVLTSASRIARPARRRHPGSTRDQLRAAIRAGLTDWGRNRVLWVLLAAVPAVFIIFATALAPGSRVRLTLDENGHQVSNMVDLAFGAGIHPAFMAPMAIAPLATLAGMFIILGSRASFLVVDDSFGFTAMFTGYGFTAYFTPAAGGRTTVRIETFYTSANPIAAVLNKLVIRRRLRSVVDELLAGLRTLAEQRQAQPEDLTPPR